MELKALKTFLTVSRLKNFSAAARELNTVQPTVSRHISELENELSVKLFLRTTHQVELTAAGRILVPEAVNIISNEKRVRILVGEATSANEKVINIGYLSTACSFFLPKLIGNYSASYSDVITHLYEMTVEEQYEALTENKIDLAFSRRQSKFDGCTFNVKEVYSDQPLLILPSKHPLAGRSELMLRELLNERFILFPNSDWHEMHEHFQLQCQEHGFSPNVIFSPNNMRHLVMSVASGLGISIVPSCTKFISNEDCVFVPIKEINLMWPLYLYYKKQGLSPAATSLINNCIDNFADIQDLLVK